MKDPEPGTVLEEQFHRLREYKSEIRLVKVEISLPFICATVQTNSTTEGL